MTTIITLLFIAGYGAIVFERSTRINKAGVALLTGVACWTVYSALAPDKSGVVGHLIEHVGNFSQILFFLMGAMAIVELIDSHHGFTIITNGIATRSKRRLLWIVCVLSFFLSAVLDNLTTTIVMISLLSKIITDREERMLFASMVVIAANAGGAWSPIGDVTTTMLWIDGRVSSAALIGELFLPSVTCCAVPLVILSSMVRGDVAAAAPQKPAPEPGPTLFQRNVVFTAGVAVLLFVPVFKAITGLPPFMGILLGLGVLWVIVELVHKSEGDNGTGEYSVAQTLRRIDLPTILFYLGILTSVAALQSSGVLHQIATSIGHGAKNYRLLAMMTGLLSAVVDNVPLVAATMGMFSAARFPPNHHFWLLLSYCAGTGGSFLIVGSAAGIAAMGLVRIDFLWYVKRISLLALLGYLSGAGVYLLIGSLVH